VRGAGTGGYRYLNTRAVRQSAVSSAHPRHAVGEISIAPPALFGRTRLRRVYVFLAVVVSGVLGRCEGSEMVTAWYDFPLPGSDRRGE